MEILNDSLILIIVAIVSLVLAVITLVLARSLRKSRYDSEEQKAQLESIRKTIEKNIYGLNDRLVMNEERWRDVNHLLLRNEYVGNPSPIGNSRRTHFSDFLRANNIKENDLVIDTRLIFVLTPFHDSYYEEYALIKEVCTQNGFRCLRGDENYFKGDIFPEMLKLIVKSNLIIANINGRNPNVMYELGIAQALDKPVLLISREPEKLPVDIKSKRFLIYKDYDELKLMIRQELQNIMVRNE